MEKTGETKSDAILTGSANLFRQKGYSATTMEEIASAVGLSKASVFHYFGSKEEILYKITMPSLEVGIELLRETVESDMTPEEKLQKALHNQIALMDQYFPRHFMLSDQDLNCVSGKMKKELAPLMSRYEHLWREIITAGVRSGQFRPDLNIKLTTYAILGMLSWVTRWYRKGDGLSLEQIAGQYIAFIKGGILVSRESGNSHKPLCEGNRFALSGNLKNSEHCSVAKVLTNIIGQLEAVQCLAWEKNPQSLPPEN